MTAEIQRAGQKASSSAIDCRVTAAKRRMVEKRLNRNGGHCRVFVCVIERAEERGRRRYFLKRESEEEEEEEEEVKSR